MKRFAFTMLELVFVIIVIGILAVLAMPNFRGNPLHDAAEQVASHIRYAQHLALVDDKFDPANATWYQNRWSIDLCQPAYKVSTLNNTATATDPLTRTAIDGATVDQFNLATKFNIISISVAGGNCRFSFDNMGRPYSFTSAGTPATAFDGIMNADSVITLQHADGNATITVVDETGYVSVAY